MSAAAPTNSALAALAASAGGTAQGVAASAALGGIFGGINYGLNAASASKAHDRSKNMITRRWQYELIALREAGINPAYLFAKGGGPPPPMRAPQQAASNAQPGPPQAALVGAQMRNLESQTAANVALAGKHRADAGRSNAAAELDRKRAGIAGIELGIIEKRPELVEDRLVQEGMPKTEVQALIRGINQAVKTLNEGGIEGLMDSGGAEAAALFAAFMLARRNPALAMQRLATWAAGFMSAANAKKAAELLLPFIQMEKLPEYLEGQQAPQPSELPPGADGWIE